MSTEYPIERGYYRNHEHDCPDSSDRKRQYSGDIARRNEHELAAIDEWLPGTEPTPDAIDLTDRFAYRTQYWSSRNCGHERNRRDQFIVPCKTPNSPTLLERNGPDPDRQ
ncbi:hypothetical protein HALLA_01670 (plasmid) [Halostagnicola larsenii XH-48]|uniref:Uncharacterized protein n=1 Tax=Halostagnicola larsenii XH-48 TaxID=797299 RepID=W0JTV2_9EURY|nr:hypothetical protein [Halostagnicola larsenii]AHG02036.1 hypothetical protein HALLA_01670 [Halostagnicola larsenii XH-48]